MSSFAITGCFQKVNFKGFNLVISDFELPSALLYALCELLENRLLYVEIIVFEKIRGSLTNFTFGF